MVSLVGLGVYFLPSSRTPVAASDPQACTHPTMIPMEPRNAQSGVTEGRYYVTNDTWNVGRYLGLTQKLYVCNYNS